MIIANNKFQPRHFLLHVHRDTSYHDLVAGEDRLRRGVDQQAEAQKNLVHQNFDRFVSAKNTIDHVYEEMKTKQLNEEQDYGILGIQKALDGKHLFCCFVKENELMIIFFFLYGLYVINFYAFIL